jgi:uncharacterized protein (TIGR02646 family)
MIRLRRPPVKQALDPRTRTYLQDRSVAARTFKPHDPRIDPAWSSFLRTKARERVSAALDGYTHRKCAYCEQVAAKDIEHFWPKTEYPARMFSWDNFLRGCKNCNNAKRDHFPLNDRGERLLMDPCQDEPLDYFVWDSMTGSAGVVQDPPRAARGRATIDLFQLNQEPVRDERRIKSLIVLFLLARVVEQEPPDPETKERLREELLPHRPWLGIIRQLILRPEDRVRPLVERALAKVPEIRVWVADWL